MNPAPEHTVVVGASLAGLRTAEALRRADHTGRITLIGAEAHLPYTRPPLSKQILSGAWEPERAQLRKSDMLDALDLDFRLGTTATALDGRAQRVSLADGSAVDYDALVLATGAEPRWLPGTDGTAGVYVLRTLDDAIALQAAFEADPKVVVVGAGFIGAEVAAVARQRGLDVTVVEPLDAPMVRGLGAELGGVAAEIHRAHGVDLRCGVGVDSVEGDGKVTGVVLSDGSAVEADLVVIGIGVIPRTGWLEGSGLELDNGIVCDQHLAAVGVEHVWAAGDVARWQHETYGELVRFEHWTVANDHGPAVAADILAGPGERIAHTPVPYVWSDQFDTKIQIIGRAGDGDELEIIHGAIDERKFVAARTRGGMVTGAVGFSSPRALMSLLPRMEEGTLPVDEARAIAAS